MTAADNNGEGDGNGDGDGDDDMHKYPQMGLFFFCAASCKAWTQSIHSWAYAHKHMLCSSDSIRME